MVVELKTITDFVLVVVDGKTVVSVREDENPIAALKRVLAAMDAEKLLEYK